MGCNNLICLYFLVGHGYWRFKLKMQNKENLLLEPVSDFKKGLALQREQFKAAAFGEGTPNLDLMCDSLENLKSDLKFHLIRGDYLKTLKKVQKIIDWYRTKEFRYTKRTPSGDEIVLPPNLNFKANKYLRIGYELLMETMYDLGLL